MFVDGLSSDPELPGRNLGDVVWVTFDVLQDEPPDVFAPSSYPCHDNLTTLFVNFTLDIGNIRLQYCQS
jgi:hypothetical protein